MYMYVYIYIYIYIFIYIGTYVYIYIYKKKLKADVKFISEVAVFVQVHTFHHILVRLSDLICFPNRFKLR